MYSLVLSFSGADFSSPEQYRSYLSGIFKNTIDRLELVLLPAHSALFFSWKCGLLGYPQYFTDAINNYIYSFQAINNLYIDIHTSLAKELECCIIPGTLLEKVNGNVYHFSTFIDAKGKCQGIQRQTHLTREEKMLGFARGKDINLFPMDKGKLGIIICTDAWYPEVSRIMALSGADIICHPGALGNGYNYWHQLAGMWKEVQQNQFFCLESQLTSQIAEKKFSAHSAIHAPCEITEGKDGYVAFGEIGAPLVEAALDPQARKKIMEKYPILSFINTNAYLHYLPHLYEAKPRE